MAALPLEHRMMSPERQKMHVHMNAPLGQARSPMCVSVASLQPEAPWHSGLSDEATTHWPGLQC